VLISLSRSFYSYSSLRPRVPSSLFYVLESCVKNEFPWSPYVMHVLFEFLLNDKMSFHKCVSHVDVHLVELSI